MRKSLPESLSVNDAVALMINLSYTPGNIHPLHMLAYFSQESESKFDHAKTTKKKELYQFLEKAHKNREEMAQALFDLMNMEIDKVRNGDESLLELEDDTFGSEKLVTASVCAWAYDIGFYIEGWEAPRHWRKKTERKYTSEYLDIIDDVIATFCEEGGEHYTPGKPPKNDAVIAYIKEKYGEFSEKIMTSIPTIVRQGRT